MMMSPVVVPESGWVLRGRELSSKTNYAPDAVGIALTDNMIHEMIKCVQANKPIQLCLGEQPNLRYGSKVQHLSPSEDPFTHELYRSTDLSPSDMSSSQKPNLPKALSLQALLTRKTLSLTNKPVVKVARVPASSLNKSVDRGDVDPALANLQSSLASENAKKQENTTKVIKGLVPLGRNGQPAKGSKFNRSLVGNTTRSIPTSPALAGLSPSLGPTSVPLSQQQAEQAKAARKPIVHLLALGPMTEKAIHDRMPNAREQVKAALEKVGNLNESTGKWELRSMFYKELDIWNFDYESSHERERAKENARKVFDKMRTETSDPVWEKLLPKSDRGKGIILSRLQAQIASGAARAPKPTGQKTGGSGQNSPGDDEEEDIFGDKMVAKAKGEGATRSVPPSPTMKAKKRSEKEAQAKRLLSKKAARPISKPAPAKREKPTQKPAGRVLSSQFVSESDDEDNFPVAAKPAPKQVTSKRPRDDDSESSDSSIPLSKKVKAHTAPSHRVSDASHSSHTTTTSASSITSKNKGNSPHKSSPLASSPPTNASEFESSSGERTSSSTSPVHRPSTKSSQSPIHKRHQKSSSVASSVSSTSSRYLKPEVLDLARKYKMFYPKYHALHQELAGMATRDEAAEKNLMEMHERLRIMKKEIEAGIVEV
ncbi:hypothetical protein B7494_g5124 [Chlorociboria aeruginascens]|nr:hypothetical protein B7494_g5124 [Chlorociboria aeruginascens]